MSNDTSNTPIPMTQLAAPAQRALTGAGYTTLEQLAKISEAKVKELPGIGPKALRVRHLVLEVHGMSFVQDRQNKPLHIIWVKFGRRCVL